MLIFVDHFIFNLIFIIRPSGGFFSYFHFIPDEQRIRYKKVKRSLEEETTF